MCVYVCVRVVMFQRCMSVCAREDDMQGRFAKAVREHKGLLLMDTTFRDAHQVPGLNHAYRTQQHICLFAHALTRTHTRANTHATHGSPCWRRECGRMTS